jgi:hypothetical protein
MLDDPTKWHKRGTRCFTSSALQAEIDDLAESLVDVRETLIDGIYRGQSTPR